MKKFLALALTLVCAALLVTGISAAATLNEQRAIPYAASAPTIDGVKSDGEWDAALVCRLNADTCDAVSGTLDTCPDAVFYWMWNYDGLYFFGDVTDSTENGAVHAHGDGSYNSGDGIQFCIYPDPEMSGSNWGDLYFWSLVICDDGAAAIGEHFVYGSGSAGMDAEDATVAGVQNGASYTIEAFLPNSCWKESNVPLTIMDDATFAMTNVIMEHDGANQSLIIDSAWFDGPNSNKYTLTGGDPAKKEEAMKKIEEEAAAKAAEEAKKAEEEAAKKAEEEAKKAEEAAAKAAAEEAAKAAEEAAAAAAEAVEGAVDAAADAVEGAVDSAAEAVEEAKSGCGSLIGGGMIVLAAVLGSAWISRRKD